MPKVIKSGILSPEYEVPKTPPSGLTAFCGAELETLENEKAKLVKRLHKKSKAFFLAWAIPCPECNHKVFFYLDITSKILRKINGYGK